MLAFDRSGGGLRTGRRGSPRRSVTSTPSRCRVSLVLLPLRARFCRFRARVHTSVGVVFRGRPPPDPFRRRPRFVAPSTLAFRFRLSPLVFGISSFFSSVRVGGASFQEQRQHLRFQAFVREQALFNAFFFFESSVIRANTTDVFVFGSVGWEFFFYHYFFTAQIAVNSVTSHNA